MQRYPLCSEYRLALNKDELSLGILSCIVCPVRPSAAMSKTT